MNLEMSRARGSNFSPFGHRLGHVINRLVKSTRLTLSAQFLTKSYATPNLNKMLPKAVKLTFKVG